MLGLGTGLSKKEGFVRTKDAFKGQNGTHLLVVLDHVSLANRLNPLTLTRWGILSIRPMNAEKAGIAV